MSNLLEQASLVMIPSGYKEDIVYSVIPTSGAGDLTFTRASNGTRIDSDGNVEVVPWNLCDYSEDQTQWTSQNETTVTANSTTAPNGTTTADTVTPSTVNDDHYRGIILGQQVGALTAFIYVKPNGYNFFDWGIYNSSQYIVRATFDLVNLTYTFTNAGTATIESVGNGWLKCGISGTNASLTTMSLYYRSRPTGGTGAFAGNGTSGAFVWGAQLNIGSTAKPYFPTTDRLNVPRLTYQNGGGGCPSLLLEKQSTNEANYSQQFDDSYWYKNYQTVTANATTSPDGTQNADLLIPSAGTGDHYLLSQTISNVSGQVVTLTLFVKKKENDYFYFGTGGASAFGAVVYQFSTNTFVVSGLSATATNFGNGWIRLSITGTTGATDLRFLFTPTDSTGSRTYNANGTDGTYIWGAQAEASSYPTSYIPTTSSSATRVADACFKTGISSLIGQTEGTIFADVDLTHTSSGNDYILQIFQDSSNRILLYRGLGNVVGCYLLKAGGSIYDTLTVSAFTGRTKLAFAYKSGSIAFYVNGSQIGTSSATFTAFSSLSDLNIDSNNGTENGYFSYNEVVIFPTRLTNSELAQLTGNQNYTINQAYASYGVASESPNCVQP